VIKRVEFIGFTVLGPRQLSATAYKAEGPDAWPKEWVASLEGPHVVLEGEGRRMELPRSRCVVYTDPSAAALKAAEVAVVANSKGKK